MPDNSLATASDLIAQVNAGVMMYRNGPISYGSVCLTWAQVEAAVMTSTFSSTPGLLPTLGEAKSHSIVPLTFLNTDFFRTINLSFTEFSGVIIGLYNPAPGEIEYPPVGSTNVVASYGGKSVSSPVGSSGRYRVYTDDNGAPIIIAP